MIRTDGVSCCILFIKTDKAGVPLKKTQKNKSNKQEDDTKYIEKVTITEEMKKLFPRMDHNENKYRGIAFKEDIV